MRSACWSMMRWNARSSARSSARAGRSSVAVTPLMEMSGARSSWLTMARNSARRRSVSSSAARSCIVTTTVSASPPPVRMGVALTSMRTLRPSGTESSTSAARRRSARLSSSSVTSRPSARREVSTSRKRSSDPSGASSPARMRFASRLTVSGLPLRASSTTTPTGEVSTSASKSARARRSSRCARALAMVTAAWAASSTSTSSSSSVNSSPPAFSPRKKCPTSRPRWRIGVPWKVRQGTSPGASPSEATYSPRSARRSGPSRPRRCANRRIASGQAAICRASSGVRPETTCPCATPASSTGAMTP